MCAGQHFTGSFHNCTFLCSEFYAVHGAAVTLRNCKLGSSQLSMTLSGEATVATLSGCSFAGCHTSIVVERGATAIASDCHMDRTQTGVIVNGAGSHAALAHCDLRGAPSAVTPFGHACLAVHRGTALLCASSVSNFSYAVVGIYSTTSIEVQSVRVAKCPQAVALASHARAVVRSCDICCAPQPRAEAVALMLQADPHRGVDGCACMQLQRCTVHGGVALKSTGRFSASLCRFESVQEVLRCSGSGGRAILSHCRGASRKDCLSVTSADAKLRVEGGRYEGATTACMANNGAILTAVDCEFSSRGVPSDEGVVSLYDRAHGRLLRCHIHHGISGVSASDAAICVTDTTITDMAVVVHCEVGDMNPAGVYRGGVGVVCDGGRVEVRGGRVQRCVIGAQSTGMGAQDCTLILQGAVFKDCVSGVQSYEGKVNIAQCDFRGLEREKHARGEHAGLVAASYKIFPRGARAESGLSIRSFDIGSVRACSVSGFPSCLMAASTEGLEISHCEFTARVHDGNCVLIMGKAAVEDCSFMGVAGVLARGVQLLEGSECAVRRCTFKGLGGDAILAQAKTSVRVIDTTVVEGCSVGLVAEAEAKVALQDCRLCTLETGVSVEGSGGVVTMKRVTVDAPRFGIHLGFDDHSAGAVGGRRTVVKLMHTTLAGAGTAVNVSDAPADLSLSHCTISQAKMGMYLRGCCTAELRDSAVSQCLTGVAVGESLASEAERCLTCGRCGEAAERAAYVTLVTRRGVPPPGARCAHEGAVTKLRMAGVEISDCRDSGLVVNANGLVEAAGLTVSQCNTGIFVDIVAKRSVFSGCTAIACARPSVETRRASTDIRDLPGKAAIPEIEVVQQPRHL